MELIKDRLYIAKKVEYHDGFLFQKVKLIDFDNEKVTFTTEWPARELCATIDDFYKLFRKWE